MGNLFTLKQIGRAAMVVALAGVTTSALAYANTFIDTEFHKESGFSNGLLRPFVQNQTVTPDSGPNYVHAFTKNGEPAVKTYWQQAGYDGNRNRRSAEAEVPNFFIYSAGSMGFQFMLPAGYPTDKEAIIGQIFSKGGCNSWSATLKIRNNNLYLVHRNGNGCGGSTERLLASNLPRDVWRSVVVQFKASRSNQGFVKAWWNDAPEASPTVSVTNLNFGDGEWSGDQLDSSIALNYIKFNIGQYNFDDGTGSSYTPGETRIIYYDDIGMYKGPDAYDNVKPN